MSQFEAPLGTTDPYLTALSRHTRIATDFPETGTEGFVLVSNGPDSPASFKPTGTAPPGAHVLATTSGLGSQHTVSGLSAGQVLRATAAGAAAFQFLQAADIGGTLARAQLPPQLAYEDEANTFTLTQAFNGNPPFTVTSATLVPNLNADFLDGQSSAYYLDLANHTGILGRAALPATIAYEDELNTFTQNQFILVAIANPLLRVGQSAGNFVQLGWLSAVNEGTIDTTVGSSPSGILRIQRLGGATTVGTDPGGGEHFRVGGNVRAQGLFVTGAAGSNRDVAWYTGLNRRWAAQVAAIAESGSDSGSPWTLAAYTDAGTVIDFPIAIIRGAGGTITFNRPFQMSNATLAANLNADLLDGQHGAYYLDLANATGVLARARLPTQVAYEDEANTFSLAQTFTLAAAFNAAGAPFTVTSSTLVTNLNADLLDGQHGAFYQNADNLNAGAVTRARLPAQIVYDDEVNTFTQPNAFAFAPAFTNTPGVPFTVASTAVVGNLNADLLDGQHGSYYLNPANFTSPITRALLPPEIAYEDEVNTFIQSQYITHASDPFLRIGEASTHYLLLGWLSTPNEGTIETVVGGTPQGTLRLQRLGGAVTVGTDTGTGELVRIGGSVRIRGAGGAGALNVTGITGGTITTLIRPFADTDSALYISNAADTLARHLFYGNGNVSLAQGGGVVIIGTDPGGSHPLRVGGGAHFQYFLVDNTCSFGSPQVSGPPFTVTSDLLVGGLNADLLDGQHGAYYLDVANATGVLARARLPAQVAYEDEPNTFTFTQTFSVAPAFTAAGAPFTVTSSTVVTNLNADLLDGQTGAFYQNAGNITTGVMARAQLPTQIAYEDEANTFTPNQVFAGIVSITSAKLLIDGTDSTFSSGQIGLLENVGELWLGSRASIRLLIDDDASGNGAVYIHKGLQGAHTTLWTFLISGDVEPGTANAFDIGTSSFVVRTGRFGTSVITPALYSASGPLTLGDQLTNRWQITTTGHFVPVADATYDIGTVALRPRNLFLGGNLVIGTDPGGTQLLRVGGNALFQQSGSELVTIASSTADAKFTVVGATSSSISLAAAAGQSSDVVWTTGGSPRWIWRKNGTAETGANAGSDFQLQARDDAGGFIDSPMTVIRAAGGAITLSRPVTVATLNLTTLRILNTNDASLTSTLHGFQVGADATLNIIMDENEIMARSNGATAPLNLQTDGGVLALQNNLGATSGALTSALVIGTGGGGGIIQMRSDVAAGGSREVFMPEITNAAAGGATGPVLRMRRARGTGFSAGRTAVLSGDEIGAWAMQGFATTTYFNGAAITVLTAEDWTDTAQGARIVFQTTAVGTAGIASRWQFEPSGQFLPFVDSVYDIGGLQSGSARRVRSIYAGATFSLGTIGPTIPSPSALISASASALTIALAGVPTWALWDGSREAAFFIDANGATVGSLSNHQINFLANNVILGRISASGTWTGYDTAGVARWTIGPSGTATGFEFGRVDGIAATTFIDFHSGATAVDYDVRIQATGGDGTSGGATLQVNAKANVFIGSALILRYTPGQSDMYIDGAAGFTRGLNFATVGVNRWAIHATETAEAGADSGSNFRIRARTDAGAFLDDPITIVRAATGAIALGSVGNRPVVVGVDPGGTALLRVGGAGAFTAITVASAVLVTNLNADLLDGQHGAYYLDIGNHTGTITRAILPAQIAYEDENNVFIAGQVIGTDPGGIDALRVGGNARLQTNGRLIANTTLTLVTDTSLTFNVGADRMTLTNLALTPVAAGGLSLGTSSLPWGRADLLNDDASLFLHAATATGAPYISWWDSAGTRKGFIQLDMPAGAMYLVSEGGGYMGFYTVGTQRWRIEAGGAFVPSTDVGYSIGSPSQRVLQTYTRILRLYDDRASGNPYIEFLWRNSSGTQRDGYLEATGDSVDMYSTTWGGQLMNWNFVTGAVSMPAGTLLLADGSVAAPSIAFINEQNLGFYRHAAGFIGVGVGASSVAQFDAGGLLTRIGQSTGLGRAQIVLDSTGGTSVVATAFTPVVSYTIPANTLTLSGHSISMFAGGEVLAQQGQVRITLNGIIIFSSGNLSVGHVWWLHCTIVRWAATTFSAIIRWSSGGAALALDSVTRFATGSTTWANPLAVTLDMQSNAAGGTMRLDACYSTLNVK